jgi:hypothetical protein
MSPEAGNCAPLELKQVKHFSFYELAAFGFFAVAALATRQLNAQQLTLEGQTGGFLTPTAYVVESAKGKIFSHPTVGIHFIDAKQVIGNIETVSITEGFRNRAEVGYTRSIHQLGDSTDLTKGAFSNLWKFDGMNVVHGKVVGIRDGQFGPWTPGVAVGGVVRFGDKFVSGAVGQEVAGLQGVIQAAKAYTNEDVYISVTKTWAHPPVPFLVNLGWKVTNATIFGIGGQSTRFGGRFFGGIGIPVPLIHGIVAVPSAGFTQEPKTSVNLGALLFNPPAFTPNGQAHIPTTLDYAVRVTQREHPHFAFDIGVGQVAGNIGTTLLPTGLPAPFNYAPTPVNLQARHVVGMGFSYRY